MKKLLVSKNFGICLRAPQRNVFFWFEDGVAQARWLNDFAQRRVNSKNIEIKWVGNLEDLVCSNCEFSRSIHREFFEMQENLHEMEDGCVDEKGLPDFYRFLQIQSDTLLPI